MRDMSGHRLFLAGFVAAAAASVLACGYVERRRAARRAALISEGLPSEYFDSRRLRDDDGELFAIRDDRGVRGWLRLLAHRELFDSVFPGYEEALTDRAFWRLYAALFSDSSVVSPLVSGQADATVITSWAGNMELFRRYGADVLLLGSSEMYHALAPALLRDGMKSVGRKVLSVGIANMSPAAVAFTAREMKNGGRRAHIAVWGYSLWNAAHGKGYAEAETFVRRSAARRSQVFSRSGASGRWKARRGLSWDRFIFNIERDWPTDDGGKRVFLLNEADIADESAFAAAIGRLAPFDMRLSGSGDRACDMDAAGAELDAALAEILAVSDKVVLYLVPTTPLQIRSAPACYAPSVRRMLRARAGPRVMVMDADWRAYGLGYRDFLKRNARRGVWWIDTAHPNIAGARKINAVVAALLRKHW
ncbi:MAG: hypothetical protein HYZ74_01990 [Elusimicrobia bacterium]|nr:hypothetical protein [Elusimicrobiota bacterium]